ncbi:molybdopterin molybdotransferase MoeA [Corynebacterium spheniscorum]|uniref:Molybdopterin molybdenumtransferase n=1 Tax=Corynebacterium spheniscorum TaxID=185761 RepID=A0A1I2V5Q5_9CORY|nr:molybdopterin molybdotransferase MoeA [Corynebacterium spheniscorum]KAA8719749.1 molybdopterin molybdotransferase MoeA [Corynebacterium spheniscorum]SFG82431.1 molybdopterin molybdotransferase [Corynebacterium spheniscorum]
MHTRTPEEHLTAVRELFRSANPESAQNPESAPPTPSVSIHRDKAVGLVLAEDLVATQPSPRFDNSQMDGYALNETQRQALPATFTLGPTLAAGTDPATLYPEGIHDRIVPIMTGAKVPEGCAAIIPVEKCEPGEFQDEGAEVQLPEAPAGQFIRHAGEDLAEGAELISRGTRLNAAAIALLASQGIEHIRVYRPARIAIITGGDEIGGPGPASIPDANGPMLDALARQHGVEVVARLHTSDDIDSLATIVKDTLAVSSPDAVITSGGISHGRFEVIRKLLEGTDDAWFGHVAQQPGGPQGLATFGGVPVICLPGNPVSTLVSFRTLVAPVLGVAEPSREAVLAQDVTGLPGRDQFLRAQRVDEGSEVRVAPIGGAGSHLIAQAVPADCLLRIPAGAALKAGDTALIYPLEEW